MDKPIALVCVTLVLSLPGWTQGAPQATAAGGLKIVVIEGGNAFNSVVTRSAAQPVVEVRDENDRPVSGADVEFTLPATGPSAVFDGWVRKQTVKTDAQGRARTRDMAPNDQAGPFKINVTATLGDKTGTAVISQTNTMSGRSQGSVKKNNNKLYLVLGVVVVGAVAGGIAASRGGSSTSVTPPNPVTIAAGPITIGGPK